MSSTVTPTLSTSRSIVSHSTVIISIPVYNEARFIQATLESVCKQCHQDFAVLISDNASTDGTDLICKQFEARDPRFRYVRQFSNIGSARNFEFLRAASSSPFFAFVGGHDLLHPDYLGRHLGALISDPKLAASYTPFEYIDLHGAVIGRAQRGGLTSGRSTAPLMRYIWSMVALEVCPIHAVFRRDMMSKLPIRACPGADHLFLSNCLLNGYFQPLIDHLYQLRQFGPRGGSEAYMARITGSANVSSCFQGLIDAYLADFDLLFPPGSRGRILRGLAHWILRDHLGTRPVRVTKLLRSAAKRWHFVRSHLKRGGER